MKKIINHLRNQPEETRTHMLHLLTIICAVALLFAWGFSFSRSASDISADDNLKESLKPLTVLKSNLVDGYNNLSDFNGN